MQILGVTIHGYGLLVGFGVLLAANASAWLARRRGLADEVVWNGLWWVLIWGLVGARLYHVLDYWEEAYRFSPVSVVFVWQGGLGILGGILAGIAGLFFYWQRSLKKTGLPFPRLIDLVFFGAPLGQAVGRLGNWLNQEVYGWPTNLPWGIFIRPENRLPELANFDRFHPLFAYEAIWTLLGFALMLTAEVLPRLAWLKKSFFAFYLIWYGFGRFFLEFLRPQAYVLTVGIFDRTFNLAQLLSLVMVFSGIFVLLRRRSRL